MQNFDLQMLPILTCMKHPPVVTLSSGSSFAGDQSWSDRADVLLDQGDYEAALHCLRQAARDMPVVDDYVSQAVCLIHLNQPQRALQICDLALSLAPKHPRILLFRGVALHRLGRFREAYACYDLAVEQQSGKRQRSLRERLKTWLKPWFSLFKGLFKNGHWYLRVH